MLRPNDNSKLHGKRLLPALTSLRILAALHVVLFHCAFYMVKHSVWGQMRATEHSSALVHNTWAYLGQGFANILGAGTWSVSFFFVLSGFILFYNYGDLRNGPFDTRKFWVARFARIYPVYLVGMIVFAPFLLRGWADNPQMESHSLVTGGMLSATLLQSWFWRYATFWNGPGWSMSAEAFFYAMFPLMLLPMRRVNSSATLLGAMLTCWMASILKVPLVHSMIDHGWIAAGAKDTAEAFTAIADYNPLARIPEFLAGVALGRLMVLRGGPAMRGTKLTAITLLAICVALFAAALGKNCPWYLAASGGLTPIFAIVIWNLTVDGSFLVRLLAWSPLVFLGEASYSVYILHLPLEHWFGYVVRKLAHSPDALLLDVPTYGLLAVYLAFMLGVCSVTYLFFEVPARDFIRFGFRRRRVIAAAPTTPAPVAVSSAQIAS
jgi:peptidoglycan/LPS O-acetylase OafA/YrhL